MANVGSAAAGKTLIGAGNGASPTYASVGTNSGLTGHGVLLAEGNLPFATANPSSTSGVPLISQGTSADPAFGTAVVAGGGTGITATGAAYAPICSGTTTTAAFQTASTGLSTSGYVLTSNGASAVPSFQATSAASFNCAFSAYLGSTASSVTGDNTLAGLSGLTELYDTGSNFNNTTGTFTAPATGIYMFVMNMYLNGIDAAHNTFGMRLYGGTPAFEYIVSNINCTPTVINGVNVTLNGTCMVQMTAGDTLVAAITVSGGAKSVGIVGFAGGRPSYFTFFQGARIG